MTSITVRKVWQVAAPAALLPIEASAHGAERGFVLLMPTGWVMVGGALAVTASVVAVALAPAGMLGAAFKARRDLVLLPRLPLGAISLLSFLVLATLVAAGALGNRDPLENPLPLVVWTGGWVLLPVLHAVFGNLWAGLNPLVGPYRLLDRLSSGRLAAAARPRPAWLGYAPAIMVFVAFAWFELVFPAPEDPAVLAKAVTLWWLITFLPMVVYGEVWLARSDPFTVFFRLLADLAPLQPIADDRGGRRVALMLPGARLLGRPGLPPSGVAFVVLTLATVSFDGLSKTFWFLARAGVNPLEYPGRTALVGANSTGLASAWAILTAVFLAAVLVGCLAGPSASGFGPLAGRLVRSLIPISLAFHVAHYLTALLVNGQYALIAAGDPMGLGWTPFGIDDHDVTTSFLATRGGTISIWATQTLAVVLGHVLAVVLAHALLEREAPSRAGVARIEAPLAAVMVGYTLFGLWVLSTPVVA